MRKLVTKRQVKDVLDHPNADRLDIVFIDGWRVVSKKGNFKPGDEGIFFEIDSLLPEDERWGFLENSKWRVKTTRIRGELSQGLLLPLSVFDKEMNRILERTNKDPKADLSDIIGVEKYETPFRAEGEILREIPSFLRKTDQMRIQNEPELIDHVAQTPFEVTEKLEGTSSQFYLNNGEFGVCSRNNELRQSDTNLFWVLADRYKIREKLEELGRNLSIQGEIVGPKIQKNYYDLKKQDLFVFDVWDIDNHRHLLPDERRHLIKDLGFNHVPVVDRHFKHTFESSDELLEFAEISSAINPSKWAEGMVFKSCLLVTNEAGYDTQVTFKAISNKFLG